MVWIQLTVFLVTSLLIDARLFASGDQLAQPSRPDCEVAVGSPLHIATGASIENLVLQNGKSIEVFYFRRQKSLATRKVEIIFGIPNLYRRYPEDFGGSQPLDRNARQNQDHLQLTDRLLGKLETLEEVKFHPGKISYLV